MPVLHHRQLGLNLRFDIKKIQKSIKEKEPNDKLIEEDGIKEKYKRKQNFHQKEVNSENNASASAA